MKRLLPLLLISCGGLPLPEDVPDAGIPLAVNDAGAAMDAGVTQTPDAGFVATPDAGPIVTPDAGTTVTTDAGITTFPFTDTNTTLGAPSALDHYACAATTNESGPERVYVVTVPSAGFLSAAVTEAPGVDADVHILSSLSATACLARGNFHAKADVAAGTYYVVVDTFGGAANAGGYRVDIGFTVPSAGACAMDTGVMPRVNDNGNSLAMPATGKMAVEAHLVTKDEPPPYPTSFRDELDAHYALSQARSGFVMHRTQDWAPLEGGTFYGAGIGSPTLFPVEHEAWYVNMYWRAANRPARGTRMILRLPNSNRAVVVAAGYETGPGDITWVGGTPEETHFYLGTGHGGVMTIGIATDQTLPLGPRACAP